MGSILFLIIFLKHVWASFLNSNSTRVLLLFFFNFVSSSLRHSNIIVKKKKKWVFAFLDIVKSNII